MTTRLSVRLAIAACVLTLAACRGSVSEQPPIHIIPDMDWQPRYQSQGESAFFDDGRAMRLPPEGTVAQGGMKDTPFYTGKQGDAYLALAPVEVNEQLLLRGQQRYDIFCTPCHDQTGGGKGTVVTRGARGFPVPPPDLSGENALGIGDGEMFEIISKGLRTMPAYGPQIPEGDRWAIVAWVRVLQRSQHAGIDDVPSQMRGKIEEAAQ